MGYRVSELILCHNNILIGDWQSLQIKPLGQSKNSIVCNVYVLTYINMFSPKKSDYLYFMSLLKNISLPCVMDF